MTEKLYYADAHMTEFDAAVLSCEKAKDCWAVVLDRTAFYPEGGGQPSDLGTLNGIAVRFVRERDGAVMPKRSLLGPASTASSTAKGASTSCASIRASIS